MSGLTSQNPNALLNLKKDIEKIQRSPMPSNLKSRNCHFQSYYFCGCAAVMKMKKPILIQLASNAHLAVNRDTTISRDLRTSPSYQKYQSLNLQIHSLRTSAPSSRIYNYECFFSDRGTAHNRYFTRKERSIGTSIRTNFCHLFKDCDEFECTQKNTKNPCLRSGERFVPPSQ